MTTIADVAVFDGHGMLPGRYDVYTDDGRITAVTSARSTELMGEIVDGRGATLLPGLIDGHVHLSQPSDFAALLRGGVTSAADMATWPPERLNDLRSRSNGFTFRSPGAPLIGPAGPHAHMPGLERAVIDSPDTARREVASRVKQGVDYIKLVLEAPGNGGPATDAARAAVDAAHAAGLRIVAHASAVGAIDLAVGIGVDILTHAPLDGDVSDDTIGRIVEDGIAVIPTLIMMRTTAQRRGVVSAYEHAKRFVATIRDAGAPIVTGSDANSAPGAPAALSHQTGTLDELELLVDAGLSPLEALRSATSIAAALFRWDDRGVVRPGLRADLVLVGGDPTTTISATRDIQDVRLAGQWFETVASADAEKPKTNPAGRARSDDA